MEKLIKVLIVDDDLSTRKIYQEAMNLAGFDSIVASDGVEGYKMFREHHPNVILTGIEMAKMDGFSLIKKIREEEDGGDTIFLINSHLDREEDRKRAQEIKVDGYFVRGFSAPINVVSHIQEIVAKKSKEGDAVYTKKQFDFFSQKEIEKVRVEVEKKYNSKVKILGGTLIFLIIMLIVLLGSVLFLLSEKSKVSLRGEDERGMSTFAEEMYDEGPYVSILSGTVTDIRGNTISIEVDLEENREKKIVDVRLSSVAESNIIKTLGVLEDGVYRETEDKNIEIEEVFKGDSISFVLQEDMLVPEVLSGKNTLVAEEVFVGLPTKDIVE